MTEPSPSGLQGWMRGLVWRMSAAAAVGLLGVFLAAVWPLQAGLQSMQRQVVATLTGRELIGVARQLAGELSPAGALEPGYLAAILRRALGEAGRRPKPSMPAALKRLSHDDVRLVRQQAVALQEKLQQFCAQHPDLRAVDVALEVTPSRAGSARIALVFAAGSELSGFSIGKRADRSGRLRAGGDRREDVLQAASLQDADAFDRHHLPTDFGVGRIRVPFGPSRSPLGSFWIALDLRPVRTQVENQFTRLRRGALAGALGFGCVLLVLVSGGSAFASREVRGRLVDPLTHLAAILGRVGPVSGRPRVSLEGALPELKSFVEERAARDELREVAEAARSHLQSLDGTLAALEARGQELEHANAALHEAMERSLQAARGITMAEIGGWVAHDLNNKLQAAYSIARDWIRRGRPCPPEQLQHVLFSVETAVEQIQTLRDLSRPRHALRLEPDVALGQVLRETLLLAGKSLEKEGVAVDATEVSDDARLGSADPSRLRDMLLNLLLNARDAIRARRAQGDAPAGVIRVRAAREREDVVVQVADNGCGIPPEAVAGLFDRPFFTTKGEQGTGLGLRIVRAAVQDHGGTIACESSVGEGTTFTIRLPGKRAAAG